MDVKPAAGSQLCHAWPSGRPPLPALALCWPQEVCQRPIRLVSQAKLYKLTDFYCWGGGVSRAVLTGGRDEAPRVFARSSSSWRYSLPLLINLCELSSGNKRWGRGSYSARPGPGKACELIALIEWEGLLSSGFLSLPGLFGKE